MRKQRIIRLMSGAAVGLLTGAGCGAVHSTPGSVKVTDDGAAASNLSFFLPNFPGAGNSGADDALVGGLICDFKLREDPQTLQPTTECFYGPGQTLPVATIEQVLECAEGVDAVHLRLTLDPAFVDNTYGETAIGWGEDDVATAPAAPAPGAADPVPPSPTPGMKPAKNPAAPGMSMGTGMKAGKPGKGGHTWKDLVGSDHAELLVTNDAGAVVSHFKLDYISESATAPSGYASLGVLGGDGKMIEGDPNDIVRWRTSIERNLNERGYGAYIVDSPATDSAYTPSLEAPGWDYRVVYEAWIDIAAFGASGFGTALIENVHASPSKASSDTVTVTPGPCPCELDGDCTSVPPEQCVADGPDDFHCGEGGSLPPSSEDPLCRANPSDPSCTPE